MTAQQQDAVLRTVPRKNPKGWLTKGHTRTVTLSNLLVLSKQELTYFTCLCCVYASGCLCSIIYTQTCWKLLKH